jgi:cytochrome c553
MAASGEFRRTYRRPAYRRFAHRCAGVLLMALTAASPVQAEDIAARWQEVCSACHGPAGHSEQPEVPSIGGQPVLFTAIQLFLFREGRRTGTPLADAMTEAARQISDSDLRAFAEFVAKLPPPPPAEGPVDEARFRRGMAIAAERRCAVCHNPDYSGREQMARLAGQREDYLVKSLMAYRASRRVGAQAAMLEAVAGLSDEQIADLAHMLAHWPKR